jgi:hypothetical protein
MAIAMQRAATMAPTVIPTIPAVGKEAPWLEAKVSAEVGDVAVDEPEV